MNYLFWILLIFIIIDGLISTAILRFWYLQEKRMQRRERYEIEVLKMQYDAIPVARIQLDIAKQQLNQACEKRRNR